MTDPAVLHDCDVLIVGSGAAGLAAAVTAAQLGLDVIVAEKSPLLGGTTAISGGWLWIPNSPEAQQAGVCEPRESPLRYLRAVLGDRFDQTMIQTFLDAGPEMLEFFEAHTHVHVQAGLATPDFYGEADMASTGGRSLVARPYDGRNLGPLLARLAPPLAETTLMGMAIAPGPDLRAFLTAFRSRISMLHVLRRLGRHAMDLLCHGRSMQLVNGNALAARLLRSAADRNVLLLTQTCVETLETRDGRVTAARVRTATGPGIIRARRAVVLACGGFPHDLQRQAMLLPHVARGFAHHSAAPDSNTGDGLRMAERLGGVVDASQVDPVAWAPVSLVPGDKAKSTRFPHLVERGKPGLIAVTRDGRRFVNEGGPYHDYMRALFAVTPPDQEPVSWLICDRHFLRRYGLGAVKPFPVPIGRWLRNGYLLQGRNARELAEACGIDPIGLATTIDAWNEPARSGMDPAFGRGTTPYHRAQGDPDHRPNPCIAPIEKMPLYAVRIVPGSLGTFAGLKTDEHARVLDRQGIPIGGLYAAGNDMNSIMGGHYPGGGITLGPAMTFGWIAARHIAAQASEQSEEAHANAPHVAA
jgi:succinate dehydrogenase/fumarate reductase flavoprotein subunit